MSLKKKAISGLLWTFGQQFSVQLINFVVSIILARILLPTEFGLIGMLVVFISIGNILLDNGMASSLIRTKDPDDGDYSTVFLINVSVSIIVYGILFVCAPLIAQFYKQPILINILRVYTLSFIFTAFIGVQATKLTKEMNFRLQMIIQLPSVIIGGLIGIYLAVKGMGVWSLVWMNLTQSFLLAILHWFASKWRPSLLLFDKKKFKHHLKFGYKLTISGILDTVYENLYNIIIGRIFPLAFLGYFTRAQSFQMFPVQNISTALNKVTYPMFASIQDDNLRLKAAYKKLMLQVIFWVAIVMITMQVTAVPLFRVVLTEKWIPAVPYFKIMCIAGILYPLHIYNLNILLVKGKSNLFFKLEVYKKILFTLVVIVAVRYGIYGLLYAQIVFSVLGFFINTLYSGKLIDYPAKEQIIDVVPVFLIGAVVAVVGWLFDSLVVGDFVSNDLLRILLDSVFCLVLYLGLSQLFKISPLIEFKELILKRK